MNRRDIVIGVVIVVILAGIIYFRQKNQPQETPVTTPQTLSTQQQIQDKFNVQIPDDVDKAELKDVGGGTSSALATRKFENGTFTSEVLADLPDPAEGTFYQAWLSKGEEGQEGYSLVSLGKLVTAKGGYLVDYQSSTDYSDYPKVMVTLEKTLDNNPETTVLEGSF